MKAPAPAPTAAPVVGESPTATQPMEAADDVGTTPQGLYAQCEERVEQPQAEGECSADADCATGGASLEVCTTAQVAEELVTAAEHRACFTVLDTCGCHDGQCTWTLKEDVPPPSGPSSLPPTGLAPGGRLPPTGPVQGE